MDMRLSRFINPSSYHANQSCFDCHNAHSVGNDPDNPRLKAGISQGCTQCHSNYSVSELLDGARGWEKASYPNWTTEAGRGANKQHLFNLNDEGLVYGLSPEQYHWVLKDNGNVNNKDDWQAIWPWNIDALDAA